MRLIDLGMWGLELPLVVRGAEIPMTTLSGLPPGAYDGPQPGTRDLAFQTGTLLRGLDVRLVQLALSERGADVCADGVFGRATGIGSPLSTSERIGCDRRGRLVAGPVASRDRLSGNTSTSMECGP